MKDIIYKELKEAEQLLQLFLSYNDNIEKIEKASVIMSESISMGKKIISCGNGGSHCDAMHFAEELTGRYRENRKSLPAIAISDPAYITCAGNDFGYEYIYSRFLEGIGQEGDVLLGISTSGNSNNIVKAVETASQKKMKVILLTGRDGGMLAQKGDVEIRVPHFAYADRIQEIHIKIIHILILLIEKQLYYTI
ncbi:MAG: D-sedoheptulose 7-phosphate isomerase [Chitinophagaceae bacterium]|nr:D-sedoheptulose 7-phosphate isomerase [Chitinophagaceae bacterium]